MRPDPVVWLNDFQRRLSRQHHRRTIPWAELDSLPPSTARLRAGEAWRLRAEQEHLAVGAFAMVTQELAEQATDPMVLGLVARAASDEVRHAALCGEYARRLLDDRQSIHPRLKGTPTIPAHHDLEPALRVLCHMVEMCCVGETLTGVYLTEMRDRTTHPTARALVDCLLEDEIDHGRVGWAYLEQRRADDTLGGLAEQLPDILERSVGRVLESAEQQPEPRDRDTEALGHLGLDDAAQLYLDALDSMILPGLDAAGVDLTAARAWRTQHPLVRTFDRRALATPIEA